MLPPRVGLSVSGKKLVATIAKGTYDLAGYTLQVTANNQTKEYNSISVGGDGTISGYTLTGQESLVKLLVSDAAGYIASGEVTLTPKPNVDDNTNQ